MQSILIALFILVAITLLVSFIASRPRGHQLQALANVAEGFQPAIRSFFVDAAVGTRYLLMKAGSDSNHLAICGATDIPKAIAIDEAAAAEDVIGAAVLGLHREGALAVASAAIAVDDMIVAAASGKVRTLPSAAGTYYIIGRATKAATGDGETVEFTPCFPIQRVVA